MNTQPIEKPYCLNGGSVDVHSVFGPTIQGEGPFAGQPAVFIRLAGCNLQCPLCDTDYTSTREVLTPLQIVDKVYKLQKKRGLVVISGGEPFRQNIGPLCSELLKDRYTVQIETNGTLFVPGPWKKVTIVCSPKTGKLDHKLLPYIDAYKYVLHADDVSPNDGLPIQGIHQTSAVVARPHSSFKGPVYLQPVDDGQSLVLNPHLEAVRKSCLTYGYILCLQIHKLLGME